MAFCCLVIPAIPAGESFVNFQVVAPPLEIVAGTGAQVPFTVPSSTIAADEVGVTTPALEDETATEERFTIGVEELLSGVGIEAEDVGA